MLKVKGIEFFLCVNKYDDGDICYAENNEETERDCTALKFTFV